MTAVLDLGSNSFIILVYDKGEVVLEKVYEVGLKAIKEEQEAFAKASCVLDEIMRELNLKIPIYAFGTAVFRERPDLFQKLLSTFGLKGFVLSEEEEAFFTYMCVDESFEKDLTVFDLGGGSLEIVKKKWFVSLPLGTHVLNSLFDLSLPGARDFEKALDYVSERLPEFHSPVGIGGSFVSLAALKVGKWDLGMLDGITLTLEDVERAREFLKSKTYEQIKQLKIIPIGRERTIVAGSVVAAAVAKREEIKVSTKGFRHTLAKMIENGVITKPWVNSENSVVRL
ncbi:MAG: guanosine polyphosphate pyrophosphohydrolase [Pseudothermotoga sp.]